MQLNTTQSKADQSKAEFIPVREAARRANWSSGYIRSLIGCGKLSATRHRGMIHVCADDLAIILRARAARRCRPRLRLVVSNSHL